MAIFTATVAVKIATWLRLRLAVNVATALFFRPCLDMDNLPGNLPGVIYMDMDNSRQEPEAITATCLHVGDTGKLSR